MKRNKSIKTVKAKPILNEDGVAEDGRVVLVSTSTDESKNDEEDETTTFEDIANASRKIEKEKLHNLLKSAEDVISDIYEWQTTNWLFKSKMKALQVLFEILDYSNHIMSMRFSYLVSFSSQSPFENISEEVENVRSLYSSIIWVNEKNDEPAFDDPDEGVVEPPIDFLRTWYRDDKHTGREGDFDDEEPIPYPSFSDDWDKEGVNPQSEHEVLVKRVFMNLDDDGHIKTDDTNLIKFNSILDGVNSIQTARYINDIKRALGTLMNALGVLENDVLKIHLLNSTYDDLKSFSLEPYKKLVIWSWNTDLHHNSYHHKKIEEQVSKYLISNNYDESKRLEALESIYIKYTNEFKGYEKYYNLYSSCFKGAKLDEEKFLCTISHQHDAIEFLGSYKMCKLIQQEMNAISKNEDKQTDDSNKKGGVPKVGKEKNVTSKTFVTFSRGTITDGHLALLYQRLLQENWIDAKTDNNAFLDLFSGKVLRCRKIIWTNAVSKGNLAKLFKMMQKEGFLNVPDGYGLNSILEAHFVDIEGKNLTNIKGGSKSLKAEAIIKECKRLLELEA